MAFQLANDLAGFGAVHNADETQVFIAEEDSPGKLSTTAGQVVWHEIEANNFTDFGPQITTGAREYFNPKRTQGKAKVQKEEAMAGWQADVTENQFPRFARAFLFHEDFPEGYEGSAPYGSKPDTHSPFARVPTPVTAITDTKISFNNTAYGTAGATLGTDAFDTGDIIKVIDEDGGPNDGITAVVVTADATGVTCAANSFTAQAATTLTDKLNIQAAPSTVNGANVVKLGQTATIRVVCVGRRFVKNTVQVKAVSATDNRAQLTFVGLTDLPFVKGETICVGGSTAALGFDRTKWKGGFATIEEIDVSANTVLTCNNQEYRVEGTDLQASGDNTIEVYWGHVFVNGSQKRTYQVERTLGKGYVTDSAGAPIMDTGTPPKNIVGQQSDVILACLPNECTVNFEQEKFVNADFTFLPLDSGSISFNDWNRALDATPPGMLCHQQAGTLLEKRQNLEGYSCQTDVHRVTLDFKDPETRGRLFTYVESATFSLNNNATGTPALGYKGYIAQNARRFEAKGNLTILFEKTEAIDAIRNNTTCFMSLMTLAVDTQRAMIYNIPNLTLSGNVAVEQGSDVKMELEAMGYEGSVGHVASITNMLHIPKWVFGPDDRA